MWSVDTRGNRDRAPLPDVAAGGATTRERSPPDITAAPRGPSGRGYAPPGRVARTARLQPQCGRNARAPRGHQARVSVGIVSARPQLPPRGAPAPTPTGWCYIRRRHLRRDDLILVPHLKIVRDVLLCTIVTDTLHFHARQRLKLLDARLEHLRRYPICLDRCSRDEPR